MGIYMTAAPIGRIIALASANSLLMPLFGGSWRMTLATYATVALVAGFIWLLIARDVTSDGKDESSKDKTPQSGVKVFQLLLRIRVVQIILIMSLGLFMLNHGLNNWLPEILREGGMSPAKAGVWSTVPIAVGIVALLVIPQIATPARRMPMLIGVFVLAGLSVLIIGTAGGWALFGGLVLQGAAGRGALPLIMITLMDSRRVGSHRMGAAGGLYFTFGEAGGVLGPLILGIVADLSGGFLGGIIFLAGLCVVLVFLAVVLGLAVREEQTSTS
jgi:cyanate permease